MDDKIRKHIADYMKECQKLYDSGQASELTYRNNFHNFLREIFPKNIEILQEMVAEIVDDELARPDFVIKKNGAIIGYIETKAPDVKQWSDIEKSPQIKKYLKITDNIIITNYFRFKFSTMVEGKLDFKKAYLREGDTPEKDILEFINCINNFLKIEPKKIGTARELAKILANRSHSLKEVIGHELTAEITEQKGTLYGLYNAFRDNLGHSVKPEDFTDSLTQMFTYSLFLAKLNAPTGKELTVNNAKEYISSSFELIRELTKFLDVFTDKNEPIYKRGG